MKYDVFISYSSKNQKTVEAICAYLEQYKIRCFVAYRDIPKGVVWSRAIVEALEESRMMLVVFSEEFNISNQVDREIELASEEGLPILTFRISDTDFKGAKKYYLKNLNWIDAYPHPEACFGGLLASVAKLLDMDVSMPNMPDTESQSDTPKQADKTYRVGDYYDCNGTRGVVFEVSDDGCHGKIVSLDEVETVWCTDKQCENNIATDALHDYDGMFNTNWVMIRKDCHEYCAFVWCRNKGESWYLPSKTELWTLWQNEQPVNATLKALRKNIVDLANKKYWSSTEYNGLRAYVSGHIMRVKNTRYLVRAIAAF